ncbi:MAG: glycosyl transferase [Actinomycetia bacterium]|nr:glycosyl transferase [Actinomycetes bacterium]
MPAVSVVIPTHDRPEALLRAVASVLGQSVTDLEVVVVDDGSSRPVEIHDDRVRVLRHEIALGAPSARNTGVAASTGDVVAFLDDDDQWLPGKLARQLAVLEARDDVALVGCHHEEAGAVYRGPTWTTAEQLRWSNFLGSTSFVVVRRSAVDEWFDPALPTCQDWDLWLRAIGDGEAVVVPEVLARYTTTGDDRLTTDTAKRVAGHDRLVDRHGEEMSPACRAYHRARRLLRLPRTAGTWPKVLASTPPSVTAVLAAEIAAARVGARAGDPGRGLRRLHRSLEAA